MYIKALKYFLLLLPLGWSSHASMKAIEMVIYHVLFLWIGML